MHVVLSMTLVFYLNLCSCCRFLKNVGLLGKYKIEANIFASVNTFLAVNKVWKI